MNAEQRHIIIGVAALVVLVGGYFGWKKTVMNSLEHATPAASTEHNTSVPADIQPAADGVEKTEAPTTPPATDTAKPAVSKPSGPLSYGEALNLYRDKGGYFQIVKCAATPGMISLKKGLKFMVDNRDKVSHRIGYGRSTYTVKGYSFLILNAATPGTLKLTCDGGGVGQVNIEG